MKEASELIGVEGLRSREKAKALKQFQKKKKKKGFMLNLSRIWEGKKNSDKKEIYLQNYPKSLQD